MASRTRRYLLSGAAAAAALLALLRDPFAWPLSSSSYSTVPSCLRRLASPGRRDGPSRGGDSGGIDGGGPCPRPVIHTFYERVDSSGGSTGMSYSADDRLLEAWRRSWSEAGWEPRVLTLEDARRHPDFGSYSASLDRVSLGERPLYDKLCYLRWLAMVSAGGGFMADFDVFPLLGSLVSPDRGAAAELPSGGGFVVYQMTDRGRAVPSMASGSAREWDRMAKALLREGLKHESDAQRKRPKIWSDMRSLIFAREVREGGGEGAVPYEIRGEVVKGQDVSLDAEAVPEEECRQFARMRAVHVSHRALELLGRRYEMRPDVARRWLDVYRRSCLVDGAARNITGTAIG